MNVNEDAVPVVLSLLDQIYGLRREMRAILEAICEQPEHVQLRIRDVYLARTERKFGVSDFLRRVLIGRDHKLTVPARISVRPPNYPPHFASTFSGTESATAGSSSFP